MSKHFEYISIDIGKLMSQGYKLHFALFMMLSLLTTSTQACMAIYYVPLPPQIYSYKMMGDVIATPPKVVIGLEGSATLNLPKNKASDRWEFKNLAEIFGQLFTVEIDEVIENNQPFTQINFKYKQLDCKRDASKMACVAFVKEIATPIIFSYKSKNNAAVEVKGTLNVTSGMPIVMTPKVNDIVVQIDGEITEGRVDYGRPYRVKWLNPALAKHHWQVKKAETDSGVPVEVKAITNNDGTMVFVGDGQGENMRIVLEVANPTLDADKEVIPKPVTIILNVAPTPLC